MDKHQHKNVLRRRRQKRVRKKVSGDADRPRLSIFRSARHMYAQVIDDASGATLVAASTLGKDFPADLAVKGNVQAAGKVGELVARKALSVGIRQVRFDRAGYKYHGRVKALADAARKAGLAF